MRRHGQGPSRVSPGLRMQTSLHQTKCNQRQPAFALLSRLSFRPRPKQCRDCPERFRPHAPRTHERPNPPPIGRHSSRSLRDCLGDASRTLDFSFNTFDRHDHPGHDMNVKRFTARTSRDALNLVRQALGDDAVVLSTKPCPDGVEVLAMAPDSIEHIERIAAPASAPTASRPAAQTPAPRAAATVKPAAAKTSREST